MNYNYELKLHTSVLITFFLNFPGYSTTPECTRWPVTKCTKKKEYVKKYSPQTECKKVPRELCGPSGCVPQPGPEECFDKKETVVQEVI